MVATLSALPKPAESILALAKRLTDLLEEAGEDSTGGQLPEGTRERAADLVEGLRRRVARKPETDLRSLFDIDDRLVELMDRVEQEITDDGQIPEELAREIDEYLEAFRTKVDRIAGYWRWQESVAGICGEECGRLSARKKAAESRVARLKNMLLGFMLARAVKKLDGEKASIGVQSNSTPSLVIDDPAQIGERFFESTLRFTKTELQEIAYQLPEGELQRRLEAELNGDRWEINVSAARAAIVNNEPLSGARLVKGHHVRIR